MGRFINVYYKEEHVYDNKAKFITKMLEHPDCFLQYDIMRDIILNYFINHLIIIQKAQNGSRFICFLNRLSKRYLRH